MSVTVEISNPANLQRVRTLLGTESDDEAFEMALEKFIEAVEPASEGSQEADLPQEYWEELFSQTPVLPALSASQAVIDDRNEVN